MKISKVIIVRIALSLAIISSNIIVLADHERDTFDEVPVYQNYNNGWFQNRRDIHIGEYLSVPPDLQVVDDIEVLRVLKVQPILKSYSDTSRSPRLTEATLQIDAEIKFPKEKSQFFSQVFVHVSGRGTSNTASSELRSPFKLGSASTRNIDALKPAEISFKRFLTEDLTRASISDIKDRFEVRRVRFELMLINGITAASLKGNYIHTINVLTEPNSNKFKNWPFGRKRKALSIQVLINQLTSSIKVSLEKTQCALSLSN